jgi:hypothetical protein
VIPVPVSVEEHLDAAAATHGRDSSRQLGAALRKAAIDEEYPVGTARRYDIAAIALEQPQAPTALRSDDWVCRVCDPRQQ